jgi:hypothetical protein
MLRMLTAGSSSVRAPRVSILNGATLFKRLPQHVAASIPAFFRSASSRHISRLHNTLRLNRYCDDRLVQRSKVLGILYVQPLPKIPDAHSR